MRAHHLALLARDTRLDWNCAHKVLTNHEDWLSPLFVPGLRVRCPRQADFCCCEREVSKPRHIYSAPAVDHLRDVLPKSPPDSPLALIFAEDVKVLAGVLIGILVLQRVLNHLAVVPNPST